MTSHSAAPFLSCKVAEFIQIGQGGSYDDLCYSIKVAVDGIASHSVERSVVDWVELDRRLRKRFPRAGIAQLPLDESTVTLVKRALEKQQQQGGSTSVSPFKQQASSLDAPNGFSPTKLVAVTRGNSVEPNSKLIPLLDRFLQSLISCHEILVSSELALFLDESVSSMTMAKTGQEGLSIHDILFLNEQPARVNLRHGGSATVRLEPQQGEICVWSFTTAKFDIGFSVQLDGLDKLAFTRYDSHREPVTGTLLVESPGVVLLKFDNSYSKWRGKQLTYMARVVSLSEYTAAKERVLEVQRERKVHDMRRGALKRACVRHAAAHSGVIHSTSVISDDASEDDKQRTLEQELLRLRHEVSLCQADLEVAADDLESLEQALDESERAKRSLEQALAESQAEVAALRGASALA